MLETLRAMLECDEHVCLPTVACVWSLDGPHALDDAFMALRTGRFQHDDAFIVNMDLMVV